MGGTIWAIILAIVIGLFGGLFATGGDMSWDWMDQTGGITWMTPADP